MFVGELDAFPAGRDAGLFAAAGGEVGRCAEDVFVASEEALFGADAEGYDGGV